MLSGGLKDSTALYLQGEKSYESIWESLFVSLSHHRSFESKKKKESYFLHSRIVVSCFIMAIQEKSLNSNQLQTDLVSQLVNGRRVGKMQSQSA